MIFSIEMWRTSVEVCKLCHPSIGHTDKHMKKVHRIVNDDSRGTISEFAGRSGLPYGTYQEILTVDIKVLQITAIYVPQ